MSEEPRTRLGFSARAKTPYTLIGLALIVLSGAGVLWYLKISWLSPVIQLIVPVVALSIFLLVPPKKVRGNGSTIALPLFLFWSTISLLWAENPIYGIRELILVASTILLAVAASRLPKLGIARTLFIVTASLGIVSFLVAFFIPAVGQVEFVLYGELVSRPVGIFGWNSSFGIVASVATVLAFTRWLMTKRLGYLAATLLFLGIVYFGQSATSTLATIAAVLASAAIVARRPIIIFLLALTAIVAALATGFASGFLESIFGSLGRTTDLTGRTLIWNIALEQFRESPIIGLGFGAAPDSSSLGISIDHAHNGYIQALLELGLIGVGFLIWAILVTLLRAVRTKDPIAVGLLVLILILNVANSYFLAPVLPLFILAWLNYAFPHSARAWPSDSSMSISSKKSTAFSEWA